MSRWHRIKVRLGLEDEWDEDEYYDEDDVLRARGRRAAVAYGRVRHPTRRPTAARRPSAECDRDDYESRARSLPALAAQRPDRSGLGDPDVPEGEDPHRGAARASARRSRSPTSSSRARRSIMNMTMTKPDLAKRSRLRVGPHLRPRRRTAEGLREGLHAHAAQRRRLRRRAPAAAGHRPVPDRLARRGRRDCIFSYSGTPAVVGGGRMGEAIVGGLLEAGVMPADQRHRRRARRRRRAGRSAARCTCAAWQSPSSAVADADIVLLAVKPQVIDAVVAAMSALGLRRASWSRSPRASRPRRLESLLPAGTPVVRVMPNTPALVGEGMAVVSGGSEASHEQVELVRALFARARRGARARRALPGRRAAISGSRPGVLRALRRRARARGRAAGAHARRRAAARGADDARHRRAHRGDGPAPRGADRRGREPGRHDDRGPRGHGGEGLPTALAEAVAAAVKRAKELGCDGTRPRDHPVASDLASTGSHPRLRDHVVVSRSRVRSSTSIACSAASSSPTSACSGGSCRRSAWSTSRRSWRLSRCSWSAMRSSA